MAEYSDRFVKASGLNIHYLDFGNESSPTLICLHGLTGNAHQFDQIVPILSKRYHVLSFDCRGRGESEWGPVSGYHQPQYVRDLFAVFETLKINRASLMGTSMGGLTSMIFAATYPAYVERVLINDIGPEIERAGLERILSYALKSPSEFSSMEEVIHYYRKAYPPIEDKSDAFAENWAKWTVKPTPNGKLIWKLDPAVRQALTDPTFIQTPQEVWSYFKKISAPVLLVRGHESDILTDQVARQMSKVHEKILYVDVPGVGHAPWLNEPEVVDSMRFFFNL